MSTWTMPRRFARDTNGAIALMFGLALVPLMLGLGAAVDYSRASLVQADLQSAVDAAVLSLGRTALESGKKADLTLQAQQAFNAGFQRKDGTSVTKVAVQQKGSVLSIEVDAHVPLVFGGILKREGISLKATAEVALSIMDLEVALVLDNTGSMDEAGKIGAMKRAAKTLIDKLAAASTTNSNISIALVPFDTHVRVSASMPAPIWALLHTGGGRDGDDDEHAWKGLITDRDQPYDIRGTLPNTALPETLYPTQPSSSKLQRIMPLSKDFHALRAHIEGMNPNGFTNTTIGLAWGLNTLTPGAPMSGTAEAPRPGLRKHIVFLTDGENTRNRWTTDRAKIDARTAQICDEIKKAGISLHTIRVVEGNETLLKSCASDPSMYHSVTNASDLTPVFDKIASQLIAMRLSR